MPDADTEHFLWQRLLETEMNVVATILEEPALRQAWLEGTPLHNAHAEAEAAKVVCALEERNGVVGEISPIAAQAGSRTR